MSFARILMIISWAALLSCVAAAAAAESGPHPAEAVRPPDVSGSYEVVFVNGPEREKAYLSLEQSGRRVTVGDFFNKKDMGGGSYDPESGILTFKVGDDYGTLDMRGDCAVTGGLTVCQGRGVLVYGREKAILDFRMTGRKPAAAAPAEDDKAHVEGRYRAR